MIFGLLPVKSPERAMQRLAQVLSEDERATLARTMYLETLEKLLSVASLDAVVVASSDSWVLEQAQLGRARTLEETEQNGHSCAADWAAGRCMSMGARTVLFVPIDVPSATAGEMQSLVKAAKRLGRPGLVIVPSEDGTGTNALVRTPPDIIASGFGSGSFPAHVQQAQARGIPVKIMRPSGIVSDLDTPEDLFAFWRRGAGSSWEYLQSIDAFTRAETYLRKQRLGAGAARK